MIAPCRSLLLPFILCGSRSLGLGQKVLGVVITFNSRSDLIQRWVWWNLLSALFRFSALVSERPLVC